MMDTDSDFKKCADCGAKVYLKTARQRFDEYMEVLCDSCVPDIPDCPDTQHGNENRRQSSFCTICGTLDSEATARTRRRWGFPYCRAHEPADTDAVVLFDRSAPYTEGCIKYDGSGMYKYLTPLAEHFLYDGA